MQSKSNAVVHIKFELRNLPDVYTHAPDSSVGYINIYVFTSEKLAKYVAKTEVRPISERMSFKHLMKCDYYFHKNLKFKAVFFIEKKNSKNTLKLGSSNFSMGDIIRSPVQSCLLGSDKKPILDQNQNATVLSVSTKNLIVGSKKAVLSLRIGCIKRLETYKSNFRLVIYRLKGENPSKWKPVEESPRLDKRNLVWKDIVIKLLRLCDDDPNCLILVSVFCGETLFADAHFRVSERKTLEEHGVELLEATKLGSLANRQGKEIVGRLYFDKFKLRERFNFASYIKSGQKFTAIYSLDFTRPNSRRIRGKNHHVLLGRNNFLDSVLHINDQMAFYYDEGCYFWGIGATLGGVDESHCFCMSFDTEKPMVREGFAEIESQYKQCLQKIEQGNSNRLAPAVRDAMMVAAGQMGKNYIVLFLMVTSDNIDKKELLQAIKESGNLPISFVFVGIGRSDFTFLSYFNKNNPKKIEFQRVNTHFVMYDNVVRSCGETAFPKIFAEKCLSQIPMQFLIYCKKRSIIPDNEVKTPNITFTVEGERQEVLQSAIPAAKKEMPLEEAQKPVEMHTEPETINLADVDKNLKTWIEATQGLKKIELNFDPQDMANFAAFLAHQETEEAAAVEPKIEETEADETEAKNSEIDNIKKKLEEMTKALGITQSTLTNVIDEAKFLREENRKQKEAIEASKVEEKLPEESVVQNSPAKVEETTSKEVREEEMSVKQEVAVVEEAKTEEHAVEKEEIDTEEPEKIAETVESIKEEQPVEDKAESENEEVKTPESPEETSSEAEKERVSDGEDKTILEGDEVKGVLDEKEPTRSIDELFEDLASLKSSEKSKVAMAA